MIAKISLSFLAQLLNEEKRAGRKSGVLYRARSIEGTVHREVNRPGTAVCNKNADGSFVLVTPIPD